jgi:hypothetical protein
MGQSQVEIKTRKTDSGAVISVGKGCLGFLTLRGINIYSGYYNNHIKELKQDNFSL